MSPDDPAVSGQQDNYAKIRNLEGIFKPKSVAVVGASANPSKIGYQILSNIIEGGYEGKIIPVHPKESEILGHKAYPTISDVPEDIDFAVISIPAPHVIATLEQCAQKNVKGTIVITSGFAEVGNTEEEDKIKALVDKHNMALLGPNTLGVVYTPSKLNATFGPKEVLLGKIAFISQSGALAISLMGWTMMEKIGLASLVSLGNKADIGEKELIEYFNDDKDVDVVVIYMEGIKDGRKFLKTKVKKPVVMLKVGRTERGAKAAASHTGSLSGSDKIYDAAFKQIGILRADTFTQAFDWSRTLSLPKPKGNNAIIITNGGGIGVSATDACEASDIGLLEAPEWLEENFRKTMPDFGSTKNPVDITGGGHGEQYRQATEIALTSDKIDAAIVLYCETSVTNPMEIAESIAKEYEKSGKKKPVVVTMVGGERSREALHYLNKNHIPAFTCVNETITALKVIYDWKEISAREKDNPKVEQAPKEVIDLIEKVKAEGRTALMEHEAREVMEKCGVPTPKWGFATSVDEAVAKAEGMYPLAMKITSPDIIHKTDVGGVVVNIRNAEDLKVKFKQMMEQVNAKAPKAKILGVNLIKMVKGIECIIGMSQDPQFGPAIMFGLGGVFVEALKDVAFRIVPFGEVEAQRLINDIQAKKVLDGFRGLKADKASIVKTLIAIQKLAPHVQEIDINPLLTNQEGSFAVDARIIL